jgi:hypothetical protein
MKHGECGTCVLQALEGLLFMFRPFPLVILACEVVQGSGFIREMRDEDVVCYDSQRGHVTSGRDGPGHAMSVQGRDLL